MYVEKNPMPQPSRMPFPLPDPSFCREELKENGDVKNTGM
jgi:hypothetical protein